MELGIQPLNLTTVLPNPNPHWMVNNLTSKLSFLEKWQSEDLYQPFIIG
jgi:hypothetical protein